MGCMRIWGGRPLEGSLRVQGSKNAALPMIAASVLHNGKTVLHNCPRIADVDYMTDILKMLGTKAWWEGNTLFLDCSQVFCGRIHKAYAQKMRSSIVLLGALVGRFKKAAIAHPGGCVIGPRPIDMHLEVLRALGTEISEEDGMICAKCRELKGASYRYRIRSVGATQQGILAAVLAKGTTQLLHCSSEPEVQWLIRFLNKRGADIVWENEEDICIHGVNCLEDVEFEIPPDRIVAGTYLCAGAITRGRVTLENVILEEIEAFLDVYQKMGGQYEVNSGKLLTDSRRVELAIPYLETEVYPGFPTDLQSPMMAVLATVPGRSHIRETIFEDRFKAAQGLQKMGASIYIEGRDAWIEGGSPLHGARVQACELRGGAALVLAGLAAQGETIVENCEYIERGYEHICKDLFALGGILERDTGR